VSAPNSPNAVLLDGEFVNIMMNATNNSKSKDVNEV
jgi:hypothetical protein